MPDPAKPESLQVDLQEVIQNQLSIAIAQALSKDTEGLVKAVVEAALSKKTERGDSYSNYKRQTKTVLEWMVEDAINDAANSAMKKWAADNRQNLIDKINAQFSEKGSAILNDLADKYIAAMSQAVRVSVVVEK